MAGIAARLEHHQGAIGRSAEQYLAKMPGTAIDHLHAIAQVLQQVGHALGDAALGLKAGDEYLASLRQALADGVPRRGAAVFVNPHQRANFLFKAARKAGGVLAVLLAKFLQTITDQPRAFTQIVLEVMFEGLEVLVTQRAAEAPDTRLADADFCRKACGGFEGQVGEVGEHVAGDLAPGRCCVVQAVFQALFDRLAHRAILEGGGR
ncbi:hypothetical protein D3C78_508730 [compost metagenome]